MEQIQNQPSMSYPQPNYSVVGRPMMPFWTAVKTCFRKYFDFTGRARRSEYWWFVLFYMLVSMAWIFLSTFFIFAGFEAFSANEGAMFTTILTSMAFMIVPILIFIIPYYAAQTRRLHDSGHSGWWIVASFVVSLVYLGVYIALMKPVFNFESGPNFSENLSPTLLVLVSILSIISMVLSIVILVFTILDSERGENKYGPSPKYQ